nr:PREDICTED: cell cycle checkpoint control protein RAD9A [Latimeria chalumnae]|eukprot:XP_014345867.1 PREDICTED: cell cycle checkpoint control protein RAD9A [Latimeria chalumnae]
MVVHFPTALDEVTLGVTGDKVLFRNYVEDDTDPSKMMLTEMNLHPEEFEYFQVKEATDITFCLKELRALLSFAENSNLPVSVHFHTAGRPVVFSLEDSVLDVNFVLATLNDRDSHSQRSQTRGGTSIPCPGNPADDFLNDDMDSYMIAMETSMMEAAGALPNGKSRVAEPPCSPTFPQHSFSWRALTLPLEGQPATHSEEEEDKEIQTPGTPPHKKFRSLFFGSVLGQHSTSNQTLLTQEVLAAASDSEDSS